LTSPGAAETIPVPDLVPDLFGTLVSLATTVLREHIADAKPCVRCASQSGHVSGRCSPSTTSRRSDMVAQADRAGDAGAPLPVASPVTHAKFVILPVDATPALP
jgi:hypothetical protein